MSETLESLRADFSAQAGHSLALPLAGFITWALIGILALLVPPDTAILVMLFGSGVIFPLGLALSQILKEKLLTNQSPLAKLMGLSVLMVNLLWALHISLYFGAAQFVSLSLAIGLGIHWIVFSWIIDHPVGIIHAIIRSVLVTVAWWLFPQSQLTAVAFAVVIA